MGKVTGFLEIEREDRDYQPVADRVKHWNEFVLPLPEKAMKAWHVARVMQVSSVQDPAGHDPSAWKFSMRPPVASKS